MQNYPHTTIESSKDGYNVDVIVLHNAHVIKFRLLNNQAGRWEKYVFEGKV